MNAIVDKLMELFEIIKKISFEKIRI